MIVNTIDKAKINKFFKFGLLDLDTLRKGFKITNIKPRRLAIKKRGYRKMFFQKLFIYYIHRLYFII